MTSEEQWADVWSQYWKAPADQRGFEMELKRMIPDISRKELIDTLRMLGTDGSHERFAPKVGVVVRSIRDKRRTDSTKQHTSEFKSSKCMHCHNHGWLNINYVITEKDGKDGIRFPKGEWEVIQTDATTGIKCWVHEYHETLAIPCVCPVGQKWGSTRPEYFSLKGKGKGFKLKTDEIAHKYARWVLKLPDSSMLKPIDICRTSPEKVTLDNPKPMEGSTWL